MTKTSIPKNVCIAGCSLALVVVAGGAALARNHHDGGNSGDRQHHGSADHSSYNGKHHHHHHCDTNGNCGSGSNQNPVIAQPGSGLVNPGPPPLHGPGSSHNPIVYHPVHGPGSSHNPIVNTGSKWPPGTVVHDHRGGKDCSYTVGDRRSSQQYRRCEVGRPPF